jgi:outer membrane protein assembly factor BamB
MFGPRERSRLLSFLGSLFVACLLLCGIASAAPSITLSRKSGPPTSGIRVSGRGFAPNVGVDIFFDTKDEVLVVTNGRGEFHNAGAWAPRGAHPGKHWVTALERNNDKGAQEPFLVQTDWSQFRFSPNHKGLNPYENVLNPRTVRGMDLKWNYSTTYWGFGSPAVADGTVYVSTPPKLYALNANSGVLRWIFTPPRYDLISSDPAVADGILYIGTFDEGLFALNAETGVKLWSYPSFYSRVFSAPAVVNGVVYFDDAEDPGNDHLYALDSSTGAPLWSDQLNTFNSSPAVADGLVYVGTDDDYLYALDALTGAQLWSYKTGWVVRSSPAVANGVVYVGSYDDNVYALNATTGALLWTFATGDQVDSSPAVVDGVVYIGSGDHNIYALDAGSGAKLWRYTTGDAVYSSPAVANGVVYAGSRDGNVYALDARTGSRLWSYTTGNAVWASPAVVNGLVYVGSYDSNLYAFGLTGEANGNAETRRADTRPDLKTLRPDFSLKMSKPRATPSGPEL